MKTIPCDRCGEELEPQDVIEMATGENLCAGCESFTNEDPNYK